ncbi:LysR substrate-binding domain-containing protein [Nocardia stercoris]|uniref:LysR substrate-binding domain-containing protein n=1 Tax=Nocardia stercoris TaxID=2483361 RepID=UPI001F43F9E4|nr:LysR substrate-binding domain-containing protein [Nocardia stercoris]
MVARRIGTSVLLQNFHRRHPGIALDVVTLSDADLDAAGAAVDAGAIDATFHAVPAHHRLPGTLSAARAFDEHHELLVGPRHPLADRPAVTPAELAGYPIRMPGLPARGEVADYYRALTSAFGFTIDTVGPVFAKESLLDEIAESAELATLIGAGTRYLWPDRYDLRRIPVRDPAPVYPMSIIWRTGNPHPALATLRAFLRSTRDIAADTEIWLPTWARQGLRATPP